MTTQSVSSTIKTGYTGRHDYGVSQNEWYGDYYYLNSSCTHSNSYIYVYSPKTKAIASHTQTIS